MKLDYDPSRLVGAVARYKLAADALNSNQDADASLQTALFEDFDDARLELAELTLDSFQAYQRASPQELANWGA